MSYFLRSIVLSLFFIPSLLACNNSGKTEGSYKTADTTIANNIAIRDLVLIYNGPSREMVWDNKKFAPYVSKSNNKDTQRWLFDGFLFLEIFTDSHMFASGYGKAPARKKEWKELM